MSGGGRETVHSWIYRKLLMSLFFTALDILSLLCSFFLLFLFWAPPSFSTPVAIRVHSIALQQRSFVLTKPSPAFDIPKQTFYWNGLC